MGSLDWEQAVSVLQQWAHNRWEQGVSDERAHRIYCGLIGG